MTNKQKKAARKMVKKVARQFIWAVHFDAHGVTLKGHPAYFKTSAAAA
jgi:hypothetical protein